MTKKTIIALSLLLAATGTQAQTIVEELAGQWQLIAANDGVEVTPGIYRAGIDTINFTAVATADGTALNCHTDSLHWRTGRLYSADWRINIESDNEGRHRLAWMLDAEKPVNSDADNQRYLYLLAENADASAIVGMTFYSAWTTTGATTYTLSNDEHNARKVYGVLSASVPYVKSLGWIEIWSSPRMERIGSGTAAVSTVTATKKATGICYDLQGRRLYGTPQRGIYIREGKKVITLP